MSSGIDDPLPSNENGGKERNGDTVIVHTFGGVGADDEVIGAG